VNTSLHGVGHLFLKEAFASLNLPNVIAVEEQRDPDPDFPTLKFPNPEEKNVLNLAIKCAESKGIQYITAQDPDADRFGAAQKINGNDWHIFTGDELGSIFAARIFELHKKLNKPIERLAMVSSTVSSRMLSRMAFINGFKYQDCLTGFKYIGNTALDLEKTGQYEVIFGYEEAIGFMFGPTIRDKDGIAGAIMFVMLVIHLEEQGKTPYSYLQELYQRYGFYKTRNGYFVCPDPLLKAKIFSRLRNFSGSPRSYPTSIGGIGITSVRDLSAGYDSKYPPDFKPVLPPSDGEMITFMAESSGHLITLTLRASGTEPKIKYYLEGKGTEEQSIQVFLSGVIEELAKDWVQKDKNGLLHSE